VKESKTKNTCATLLTILILPGLSILSPVFSLLTTGVTIKSHGIISVTQLIADSGSPQDIQAAVNYVAAAGGGTLHIPAGNWHWNGETVTIPGGVNVIGYGSAGCDGHPSFNVNTASVILHNDIFATNWMFELDGTNGLPIRIANIQFEATAPDNLEQEDIGTKGIHAYRCTNLRVDHCTFIDFSSVPVLLTNTDDGPASGVIDHCVINNPYKLSGSGWSWAYGFYAQGRGGWWNDESDPITGFLGKYESIPEDYDTPVLFVEDCKMSYCRHAVDAIQGAWLVTRYCYIDHPYPTNFGQLEVHGSEGGSWPSARGFEFYNNVVVGETGKYAECSWLRGGGGTVFGNSFTVSSGYGIVLAYEGCPEPDEVLHNVWIWDNNMSGGTLLNSRTFTEGEDYFLRAPNMEDDGFAYTPYTYPHPLTTQ